MHFRLAGCVATFLAYVHLKRAKVMISFTVLGVYCFVKKSGSISKRTMAFIKNDARFCKRPTSKNRRKKITNSLPLYVALCMRIDVARHGPSGNVTPGSSVAWTISRTDCTCTAEHQCAFGCVASNQRYRWILCRRRCTGSVWYLNDTSCVDSGVFEGWMSSSILGTWTYCHRPPRPLLKTQSIFYHHRECDGCAYCQRLAGFWSHDHR